MKANARPLRLVAAYVVAGVAARSDPTPPGGEPALPRLTLPPVRTFEEACARCHGPRGSFYGQEFARLRDPELTEYVDEMMRGPGMLHPTADDVLAMTAYHRALARKEPFIAVLNPAEAIESGFHTVKAAESATRLTHPGGILKIRLEVDTAPPAGFQTESRAVLLPMPFAVRAYSLPDLFAGTMRALLCRRWKSRVKGRDWYDLVWYVGHHAQLRLSHLESRMRHTGDWTAPDPLTRSDLLTRLRSMIASLDVDQIRQETERCLRDTRALDLWSREFFLQVAERIETI